MTEKKLVGEAPRPAFQEQVKSLPYKIRIHLRVGDGKDVFGPGIAELLEGIKQYGSLLHAAEEMHMAYSKAWKALRKVEKNLGFALIFRQVGRGCGSSLTPEGEWFLNSYVAFLNDINSFADENFEKYFSK